jgi:hypothetical protein
MVQDIIWKADSHSACQKISCFLINPKVHYRVHKSPSLDPILSQLNPVAPSIPTSLRSVLIVSFHLGLGLPSALTFGPPNQDHVNTSPLTHPRHISRPLQPPWFNYPKNLGEEYRLWSSSLCNFLHDPSSSLLGPNILLNTLFPKTLSLCSLKVRDQVSHPYSTTGKTKVLYILIFRFFMWDEKINDSEYSPNLIYSWFHQECHSDLLVSSPSIWMLPHFQMID